METNRGEKPKLEVLDALRGFCALAVVLLHFTEYLTIPGRGGVPALLKEPVLPHGYFPVEYFFILTGFTFVYAYEERWRDGGLTVWRFFLRRLKRLHPLVIVGTLFGAMLYLLMPERTCLGSGADFGRYLLATAWCCTLIPMPQSAGWPLLHVMQGPLWTLFYIYVANIAYALVLRHLKTWLLGLAVLAAAGYSYYVSITLDGLDKGWTWNEAHRTVAFARLAFPVLAGMFIARKGWRIRTGNAGLPICVTLLAAVFLWPLPTDKFANAILDSSMVVVVFPLVLLCGIGGTITNRRLAAVCRFMGAYSFPLFVTHYPLRVVQRTWMDAHPGAPVSLLVGASLALVFFAFVNGWVAMRFSEWLTKRIGK